MIFASERSNRRDRCRPGHAPRHPLPQHRCKIASRTMSARRDKAAVPRGEAFLVSIAKCSTRWRVRGYGGDHCQCIVNFKKCGQDASQLALSSTLEGRNLRARCNTIPVNLRSFRPRRALCGCVRSVGTRTQAQPCGPVLVLLLPSEIRIHQAWVMVSRGSIELHT